jgi:hypothetical protein
MAARSIYCVRYLQCAKCGKDFIGNHPRSKYCSHECYRYVERQKHNEKRALNPAHFRALAKQCYERTREVRIEKAREYQRSDRGKELQRKRSAIRRITEKDKVDARNELNRAINRGLVVRGRCRDCDSTETHGHHPDYSKPLDVIWLCPEHHIAEHRRIDDGL